MIDGILWILHNGSPWRDLPGPTDAPWQTVHERFNRWTRDGTRARPVKSLHARLDAAGKIDRGLCCIDGSSIRAGRNATGASPKMCPHLCLTVHQNRSSCLVSPQPLPHATWRAPGRSAW